MARGSVKRRAALTRAVLGVLLAGAGAWRGGSGVLEGWSGQSPIISAEVRSGPGRGAPEQRLIRSIEVTRPRSVGLAQIESPSGLPPRDVEEPPPACDAPPRALLRAGCPDTPPAVSPCAQEGLECRYATPDACTALYECLYGLWSPLEVVCPDGSPGQLLSGTGQCEPDTPVADSPCTSEGLSCGHQPCGIGGYTQIVAECRCGRWYQRWQQCPVTR